MRRTGFLLLVLSCSGEPDFVAVNYTIMGTTARVVVPREKRALADSAYAAMLRVDSLMSKWRKGSEVSRLNASGGPEILDPEVVECLGIALDVARATGGAFDPTVWPLVHAWGFDTHSPGLPDPDSLEVARGLVDWQRVRMAGDTVSLGPGQALDLGGVAKGFALDLAARKLREKDCRDFIVEIGGDLVASGSKRGQAWTVGIRDPKTPSSVMGVIHLRDAAVCTSGDYERFFESGGVKYSHIINPKTGEPARGVISVTVIAKTGARADALATGFFVLGPDKGLALAEELGCGAMFVLEDMSVRKTRNFPEVIK